MNRMDASKLITVFIADGHAIVREGIAAKFAERSDLTIIGECSDGESAVQLILALQPFVAVLDISLPKLSGVDVVRQVRRAKSATRLIVLSSSREEGVVTELFRSGADAYVLKDGPARHLIEAVDCVLSGAQYLTPLLLRQTTENDKGKPDPLTLLSKREFEVFSMLVDGMRPKDIARILDISPKTVDTYRANIMRKLDVEGIAGLVRFAIQRGPHVLSC